MEINCKASTRTVEHVLDKEHDDVLLEACGQLKEVTIDFVDNVERDTEDGVIRECITVKEFIDKFKNWNETTSTSPLGSNLSHCLAMIKLHSISEKDKRHAEIEP